MVFREDYGVERPRVRASVGKRMAVACSNKDLRRAQSSDGMVHKMRKTNRVFRDGLRWWTMAPRILMIIFGPLYQLVTSHYDHQ